MKRFLLLALLSATAVTSPLAAAPKRRAQRPPASVASTPSTASRDLPKPVRDAKCPESSSVSLRWMSAEPHQPLLIASRDGVRSAAACCDAFARKGAAWLAVDARGTVVGEGKVTGGERDPSGCFALDVELVSGAAGVGLWVEKPKAWDGDVGDPAPSPDALGKPGKRWTAAAFAPTKEALAELSDLYDDLTIKLTTPRQARCASSDDRLPFAKRALFFQQSADMGDDPEQVAVVGGHVLVVASRERRGWRVRHVDVGGADRCNPRAYRPLAAIDLDADGTAELVVRREDATGRGDVVLAWDREGDRLHEVAERGARTR